MKEITIEQLELIEKGSYELIDIRDEGLRDYGMIPGALAVDFDGPEDEYKKAISEIPADKKLIFYCQIGRKSRELDEYPCLEGRDCFSLAEGYIGYVRSKMTSESEIEEKRLKAEDSIRKKFHKQLFSPFAKACKTYKLIEEGDRIAVCISGGKDSMLMAKLFQEIKNHRKVNFELTFLVMDPGYNKENRALIESNAKALGIPITIFESDIFDAVDTIEKNPCYLCARMRRGYLYSNAQKLGCNKIALGHHLNDVIETTVMAMFYSSQLQGMLPKLHSTNFEGMELIRPLYCIREEDILAWRTYNELEFIQCACRFTENCSVCDNGGGGSRRQEIKTLIRRLKRDNPQIETSIFNSIHSVNIETFPGYKKNGSKHTYLEEYDA